MTHHNPQNPHIPRKPMPAENQAPEHSQYLQKAPPSRAPPPVPLAAQSAFDLSLPNRLQKEQPQQRPRALSSVGQDRSPYGSLEVKRARGNSLAPPITTGELGYGRSVSTPISTPTSARVSSYNSADDSGVEGNSKRRSWLGLKSRSKNTSQDLDADLPQAWINAGQAKITYAINILLNGDRVPELWDEQNANSDSYIYLFARESGRGPQFKVPSDILSCSPALLSVAYGNIYSTHARTKSFEGRTSLSIEDATRNLAVQSPDSTPYNPNLSISDSQGTESSDSIQSLSENAGPIHLYFPVGLTSVGSQLSQEDVQKLVDVRNLFAFLTGQPLISTRACPSTFRTFLGVAEMLKLWQFSNMDGSSFGESAEASFAFCCGEQGLADVRNNKIKTLQALILGERMRNRELYVEAFAHAAGTYRLISGEKALWSEVSANTRSRLERAYIDLKNRRKAIDEYLTEFEFPSVFAGIGASTSSPEAKVVKFKTWKANYLSMRRHVLSYYKDLHGQWPPRASSKKNNFAEGGLNRLVLKGLYNDLCAVYDYLVDRDPNSLTTRTMDLDEPSNESLQAQVLPASRALRKLLAEFDKSSPPVKPPIPFDIPQIPTVESVVADWSRLSPRDRHKQTVRKLRDHETSLILAKSHNLDAEKQMGPFLASFRAFEEKEAKGLHANELAEMRYGHWIFLYVCIQTLPYLVMDAPGLKFTESVEYFLCEPPLGNSPWVEDADSVKMSWYGVTGGQGVVSLPSDIVNYGVEATYRRSHCWTAAAKWLADQETDEPQEASYGGYHGDEESMLSPLSPPPGFGGGELGVRPSARQRGRSGSSTSTSGSGSLAAPPSAPHLRPGSHSRNRQSQRNSIALGLERLPIPVLGEDYGRSMIGSPVIGGAGSRGNSPFSAGGRRPYSRGNDLIGTPGGWEAGGKVVTPTTVSSPNGGGSSGGGTPKGSTFDDILSSMGPDESGKEGKRRGLF